MARPRWLQYAALAPGMRRFLRERVSSEAAERGLADRLARRGGRFVALLEAAVFRSTGSVYRKLFDAAGWDLSRVTDSVRKSGVEATLAHLRDDGVALRLDEFKGRVPIERAGVALVPSERDFDNPLATARALTGRTSGSRSRGTRVLYDWAGLAEEAELELLLYRAHGVLGAPLALWLPAPPGVAGLRNLLLSLRRGQAPERWFSQISPRAAGASFAQRALVYGLALGSRVWSVAAPYPRVTPFERVEEVVEWLAAKKARGEKAVLRTFASSAIRVAEHALSYGVDLEGQHVFTGGEPLTAARRSYLAEAGLEAGARYSAAELGIIAGACAAGDVADAMHVYTDRVALIPGGTRAEDGTTPLLATSLCPHGGKLLINVDLGDHGRLERRACGCALAEAGLDQQLSGVRSSARFTGEGSAFLVADVEACALRLVQEAGGSPNDLQLVEEAHEGRLARVLVIVHPRVTLDEERFRSALLDSLARLGPAAPLAAELWRSSGLLRLVRERPRPSAGGKLTNRLRSSATDS